MSTQPVTPIGRPITFTVSAATSVHPAVEYLTALFRLEDVLCVTFIHSTKVDSNGNAITENSFQPLSKIISEQGIADLTKRNSEWHIYVSMAPFKEGSTRRLHENISEVLHVFIEADDNGEEVLEQIRASIAKGEIPPPSIILQSSPHRYQFIWNVDGFTIESQQNLNKTLMLKFGTDHMATDAARVLRVAGFKNIKPKYADPKPIAKIIEHNEGVYTAADFKIPVIVNTPSSERMVASDETIQQKLDFLTDAMDEAGVGYFQGHEWRGGYLIALEKCPWCSEHTTGDGGACAIVHRSGAYDFKCQHAHCHDKRWDELRKYMEQKSGRRLQFASKSPTLEAPQQNEAASEEPFETPQVGVVSDVPHSDSSVDPSVPKLSDDALYGLAGDIVKKIMPETESHPAGLLVQTLMYFGNIIGRTAYFQVESDRHYGNLFAVRVGDTSKGRKGTGGNRINAVYENVDRVWFDTRVRSGLSSGEGLIVAIQDDVFEEDETGKPTIVESGIHDKRLLAYEGEFSQVLAVMQRQGATIATNIRNAWDGKTMETMTIKPRRATGHTVSILGDITGFELKSMLTQQDSNNGFANRFLWVHVGRTKLLPFGGEELDFTPEVKRLKIAIEIAKKKKRIFMDENARKIWGRAYERLAMDHGGLFGAVTSRGEAQVIRLALIYAIMDCSDHILSEHLHAALAFWQYCEDSARYIFDGLTEEQKMIVDFLRENGSQTKTAIMKTLFSRNRKADLIAVDLEALIKRGLIGKTQNENGVDIYYVRGRK